MLSARRMRTWLTPSPSLSRKLKLLGLILSGLIALFCLAVLVHRGLLPIVAWFFPGLRQTFWDLAVYGIYPSVKYVSFDLRGPEASVVRWDETCEDGLVFAAPYGPSMSHEGPMILDPQGKLVWATKRFGTVINFRVQKWQGKNHLTFWAGRKTGSSGTGAYFILDASYNVVKKVHAVGEGLKGDLHEFEITSDGTALITIYTPKQVDMRPMGLWRPKNGWIMDSMFQEIDIETGKLLFEWRASDHFRPEETFYTNPFGGRSWKSIPFDFYHINSMQKDQLGNFLVSSRHLHTISYINGSNGDVEWTLGGAYKDFEDLSEGRASDFRWQHDARWFSEEEHIISVFDNQAAGPLHEDAPYSRGMVIQLDLENKTARLLQTYVSVGQTRAASQGSLQLLESTDHVLAGWGSSAAWTEFDIAGDALCEVHLAAESSFWWERVKSYRVYKEFDWVGKPEDLPVAVIKDQKVYTSWNGATTVKYWELQGSNAEAAVANEGSHLEGETETPEWEAVEMMEKNGFEEAFELPTDQTYLRYRIAALDEEKMYIRYSDVAEPVSTGPGVLSVLFGVVVAIVTMMCIWFAMKVLARRRRGRHGKASISSTGTSKGTWELGSIAKALGRRGNEYEYSKLPE